MPITRNELITRLHAHEGDEFHQIRGKPFTYKIEGEYMTLSTTKVKLPIDSFVRALELLPLENTVPLQATYMGPAFVYAVLMDKRVRKTNW